MAGPVVSERRRKTLRLVFPNHDHLPPKPGGGKPRPPGGWKPGGGWKPCAAEMLAFKSYQWMATFNTYVVLQQSQVEARIRL